MWAGDVHFQRAAEELLKRPIKEPEVYDDTYNPLRSCVAIYGHELSAKADAVRAYCSRTGLANCSFSLTPEGSVEEDLGQVWTYLIQLVEDGKLRAGDPTLIVILEHADRLCFDCTTEASARDAISLQDAARGYGVLFACCMDRTPLHLSGAAPATSLCTPRHQKRVFEQFANASIFFSTPPSGWIANYYQQELERFCDFYARVVEPRTKRPLTLSLTDGDYTVLADASKDAPVGLLDIFLKTLYRDFCAIHCPFKDGILSADNVCAPPYVNSSLGVKHIAANPKLLQDGKAAFEALCGGARASEKPKPKPASDVNTSDGFVAPEPAAKKARSESSAE